MPSHPFDAAAEVYDRDFTDPAPGRWYRDLVWRHVRRAFEEGDHILDLGCGTGEDAVFLAGRGMKVQAVDLSSGMLDVARGKAEQAGLGGRISFARCDLAAFELDGDPQYDGALSNFGPLNCLEHLAPFAERLAGCLRPGAPALFVIMGPLCPWEIFWYLCHGRLRTAFRRFKKGLEAPVGGGETIKVWYHSPRSFQKAFQPYFEMHELIGIGSILPPPYLSGLVARAPRFFKTLAPVDRGLGRVFPFTWLNDHYLVSMERKR